MARNRRKVEGELTISWVVTRLVLFCLLVGLFLGITFLQRRNLRMGDELRLIDRQLVSAKQKTANLEALLARSRSPREIEARMERMHLSMARPTEGQIRRFYEPEAHEDRVIMPRMLAQTELAHSTSRNP